MMIYTVNFISFLPFPACYCGITNRNANIRYDTAKQICSSHNSTYPIDNDVKADGNRNVTNGHAPEVIIGEDLDMARQIAEISEVQQKASKTTTDKTSEFQVPDIHCRKCKTIPDVEQCDVVSTDSYSGRKLDVLGYSMHNK